MKGNKKVLVLAVLVLLLSVVGTYAIYRNSANGAGSVNAANWSVQINGTDIAQASFNFTGANIIWDTQTGYNNTIAPGSAGHINIPVDADGSEVDVDIVATLGQATLPTGMTVSVHGGNTQTINYSATAGAMEATVQLDIVWTGTDEDTSVKDGTDLAVKGTTLSIPVTLTAKQHLS